MKVSNGDIFIAREPIQKLVAEKFPVLVSFKLAKLANKLNEQLKIIDEVRQGLIRKYGEANDKGQTVVTQDSANFPQFVAEFEELMAIKVEMVLDKVRLPQKVASTCDACKHNMDKALEIEPSVLMALEPFIEVTE